MITSLVSTFCGALFGGFQNYFEHKQDSTREIQIAKIQADKEVLIANQQASISRNQVEIQQSVAEQERYQTETSLRQLDVTEYQVFAHSVEQTSMALNGNSSLVNIANFITSTLRPFITYITLFLVIALALRLTQKGSISENELMLFELALSEFNGMTAYWFVRRSFEKRQTPYFEASKKKVK